MKKLIVAASCALALVAGTAQAQERNLRIAFDVPYEPFEYKDENGDWIQKSWPCTTEPGKYWLENPTNVNGTAVLVPGQYRSVWKIDLHQGKYEALCQRNGTVKVYRDDNKDDIIDCDPDSISEGYFGINIHKAGAHSTQIDRWSAGCQVFANESDFDEFMVICRKAREKWGNAFSYTLILEDDKAVT